MSLISNELTSNEFELTSNEFELTSYVINLKRRSDRKEKFLKKYNDSLNSFKLNIVEAIDGSLENNKSYLNEYVSDDMTEYKNNPRIHATIMSHVKVWSAISTGSDKYAIIFEDDINFRDNFNLKEYKISSFFNENVFKEMDDIFKDKESIIYAGAGDCLPIHTRPPTESALRAQEKSHVIISGQGNYKNFEGYKNFGPPNTKSAYVFDWFGAFSYILSKETATYLLDIAQKEPINKAVDVWLKDKLKNKYLTIPLLSYHDNIDGSYDSDVLSKIERVI